MGEHFLRGKDVRGPPEGVAKKCQAEADDEQRKQSLSPTGRAENTAKESTGCFLFRRDKRRVYVGEMIEPD